MLKKLFRDQRGEDMIEYGLLVLLIAIVAMAGVKLVGEAVDALFGGITW